MRWILAAIVVAGSCWTILTAYAADPATPPAAAAPKLEPREEHDFGAAIVLIYTPRDDTHPTYLSQASVQRLGDRLFIAGKYPRFPGHEFLWDLPVWCPLSEVTQIMEFESVEDALKKSLQTQEQPPTQSLTPTREPS